MLQSLSRGLSSGQSQFGWLLFFITVMLCPWHAWGQVPRIQGQGTAASGMGNAFVAQADDASALHYNPAGLTQLRGVEFMAGALLSGGVTRFTGPTGVTATGDRNGSLAWPPPAHVYLTAALGDVGLTALKQVVAGVGLTVPFGSLTRWPSNGPFRTATVFNALPLLDIKPTVAYEITQALSVGVGADIYTFSGLAGDGQVERRFIWAGGLGIPAGSTIEVSGKDTAAGFNVSLLYQAIRNQEGQPVANIGLVYRSQATLHLKGSLLANGSLVSGATATLVLPQVISGGVAIWPVRTLEREWKLELDIDVVGWKAFRNLDVHLSNGVTIPQPLNWRDTYATMIGSEYKWLNLESAPGWNLAVRAGYSYQQTQMPDSSFDPGVPSADVHILGAGAGFFYERGRAWFGRARALGIGAIRAKGIGLDLSYQASIYENRTVSGNRNPTVNGTYKTTLHTGGVSIRLLF